MRHLPQCLTIQAAALRLSVSPITVRRLIRRGLACRRDGIYPVYMVGRNYLIPETAILSFLEKSCPNH
jgi:excisionase family DNA binding protein